jgi:uncharacterized protein YjgD (DUF1641 family)
METSTDTAARLERIESMLEKLTDTMAKAPSMISMATDTFDEIAKSSLDTGITIDDRVRSGGHILTRLTDPATSANIHKILDVIDQAPGLMSMIADTFDEYAVQSAQSGITIDQRLKGLIALFNQITEPGMVEKIEQLVSISNQLPGLVAMGIDTIDEVARGTDLMGPQNISLLTSAMKANQYAHSVPPSKVGGIFGLLKVLKDEEVQKMLGFMINFAKAFGKEMDNNIRM